MQTLLAKNNVHNLCQELNWCLKQRMHRNSIINYRAFLYYGYDTLWTADFLKC